MLPPWTGFAVALARQQLAFALALRTVPATDRNNITPAPTLMFFQRGGACCLWPSPVPHRSCTTFDPRQLTPCRCRHPQNLISEIRAHEYDHLSFMQSKVNGLGGPVPSKPPVSLPHCLLIHSFHLSGFLSVFMSWPQSTLSWLASTLGEEALKPFVELPPPAPNPSRHRRCCCPGHSDTNAISAS